MTKKQRQLLAGSIEHIGTRRSEYTPWPMTMVFAAAIALMLAIAMLVSA